MRVTRTALALALAALVGAGCEYFFRAVPDAAAPGQEQLGVASGAQDETGPFPKTGLFTIATSGSTGPAGIADDPAIWVHPADPSLSLVIGTNKNTSGGLHVFDLQGTQLQFVAGGRHNNADLRYGFALQGNLVDLVSACDRTTNQIDVYAVDSATRTLTPVGNIQTGVSVYGYIMYHSRATGRYYGIVSSGSRVEQWEFVARADGTVGGVLAKTYATSHLIEGMVADDELGWLYLAEESTGIYRYDAEPGRPNTRLATVDVVGSPTQLVADIEGLTLYYRRGGLGYLIASSQGNDRFIVYRREGGNAYLGTFTLTQVGDTDGIDVNNMDLGSLYPQGMFVAQNSDSNFRMARWQDVANALGLAIDTPGYNVRGRLNCGAAAVVAMSPPGATLDAGATIQLQAAGSDSAGGALGGCPVLWSSSDAAVATVSAAGLVRGVTAGAATITAVIGGASGAASITVVTPVNHAPVVTVSPVAGAPEGTSVNVSATFTDDALDTHTAVIEWGDGSSGAGAVNAANRTVSGSHVFASAGSYTIRVTVTDNQGEAGQGTAAVTVTDRPPLALYLAIADGTTVGGQAFANEDILAFDGARFSLFFDGSDVGLASFTVDAFEITSPTSILLSFTSAGTVGGVAMDDSDVLRFTATSLGAQTAGTFSMYFDASDVGLTTSDEDVDAIELLPDGRLLLSTTGAFSVPGLSAADEDLVAFVPTALGSNTAGFFALYFDGSDVGLSATGENVDAVAVDGAGRILLSTSGSFAVTGLSGADEDVFVFTPVSTGSTTSGTFAPALLFDGSVAGLGATDVVGAALP